MVRRTGGGVGPLQIDQVIGVLKAYSTRVGSGPLPTELDDEIGEHLVSVGREFGTTTGRRRRCGWLDLVPLRYAAQINSATSLMLNKLDILSGLAELKVCVAYRVDGRVTDEWPLDAAVLERAEPVYETYAGWTEDLRETGQLRGAARGSPPLHGDHRGAHRRADLTSSASARSGTRRSSSAVAATLGSGAA